MDPKQALIDALEAISWLESADPESSESSDRRAEAVDCLRNLAGWLENGGFPPNVMEAMDEAVLFAGPNHEDPDGPIATGCV